MEHNEEEKSISIADLWQVFVSHMWVIIAAALVAFTAVLSYQVLTYTPRYSSTATIYILRQDDSSSSYPTSTDFTLALNTVNDCRITLTSHHVLDQVIEELGMQISYNRLCSMISITNPDTTRFLEVKITAQNPSDAKIIVDKLCEIGREAIVELMGIDQVNIVDNGTYSEIPTNSKITSIPFIAGLGAAVALYAIFVVIFMADGRIITTENVEKMVGLPVLGSIPFADPNNKDKHGRYGKYGKYGYGTHGNGYYGGYGKGSEDKK